MPNEASRKRSDQTASPTGDAGAGEVAARVEKEQERGYRGHAADPTPNHAYTIAGVTSGEPTPETDTELKRAAVAHATDPATPVVEGT